MSENKVKQGAPTKYTTDIPDKLVKYFSEIRTFILMDKEYPEFNSIEGFCADIKIAKSTFYEWVKIYPDLSNAFNTAKNFQAKQLFNLTANRIFSESYGKLLTVNCTDMKDKVEQTIDHKNIQINIDKADSEL